MHHYFIRLLVLLTFSVQCLDAQSILKDFEGRQVNQFSVYLEWSTRAGNTCADLSIERSFEGGGFEEVYQYNGICGETDKDQNYNHTDSISYAGRFGYRINENNGDYSDTIFVQAFTDGAEAVAYPNPSSDRIYLRFKYDQIVQGSFSIVDNMGIVRMIMNNADLQNGIDIAKLPAGIYELLIYQTGRLLYSLRFVHGNDAP
jgi:hypothetical protein